MTLSAIVCYAAMLAVPALTLLSALRCKNSAPGAGEGYPLVPHTAEASAYVQKLIASRYMLFSILTLVCGIGFMLLMPCEDVISLLCCAGIALGLQIVVLLVGMTSVGMALQSHFKTASL